MVMVLVIFVSGFAVVGTVLHRGSSVESIKEPFAKAQALGNPPADISPSPNFVLACSADQLDSNPGCLAAAVSATTTARASEGVGALALSTVRFQRLTVAEQLFAIVNLERTARGFPPFVVLSNQLDRIALIAAQTKTDPQMGRHPSLAGSGPIITWAGNWAGNTFSAMATNYYFMYADGPGGYNASCTRVSPVGCWGHRDNILGRFLGTPSICAGKPVVLAMGAAEAPEQGASPLPSFAEVMSESCGLSPPSVAMTWTQASRLIRVGAP